MFPHFWGFILIVMKPLNKLKFKKKFVQFKNLLSKQFNFYYSKLPTHAYLNFYFTSTVCSLEFLTQEF